MDAFLHMGGYAGYVWPSFAVTVLVMGGLVVWSLAGLRRVRARLAALEGKAGEGREP